MKLILLESYEADLSNSGYNIQFGEELTEIQTNLYSVCKHSDTFLAHCILKVLIDRNPGVYSLSTQYNELIRSEMDKHTMLRTYAGSGWKDMKKRTNIVKYKSVKQWRRHPGRRYASPGKIRQRVWVVLEDKNECGME